MLTLKQKREDEVHQQEIQNYELTYAMRHYPQRALYKRLCSIEKAIEVAKSALYSKGTWEGKFRLG